MTGRGKTNERTRTVLRLVVGVLAVTGACWLPAGAAYADETNTASHNGPRIGLVNVGQVDDPMEDVLEHFLLLGEGYRWG
ncbi:hypothetical protein J7F01_14255 [Streptomyces sp. ISL-22]|uniref:Uncharacterized protein n=1 Tax=Streptomyces curacoi TaxID=146536 RepID=A0A124H7W9_9ACTN|nr:MULTISPECIES: hypothetical protein [Streptomyces]KUM81885.1 hypothetical protein AQI70_00775 [Streptomyces curacoi]MBT2417697.1 hypothetical protein [Streptomyces sp. ISL-24]MBT2433337.1 hypothetical protein [Streptomyces sp. ISL-22]